MKVPRPTAFLRALACGLALSAGAASARATSPREYELKAAFLYNFTKFVAWPGTCFPDTEAPVVIGVYGRNPFGPGLIAAFRDRRIDGRRVELREVSTIEEARQAHLVFFPASEDRAAEAALAQLREARILTVGETPAFRAHGGIITFLLEGDKLRFAIDTEAAQRAGLKISAQLQKLAHQVRRNP